jgi:hypothetical protein
MLDPGLGSVSKALETALDRILPFNFGERWKVELEAMSEDDRSAVAKVVSRSVRNARRALKEIEDLRAFAQRASINTLRIWGLYEGCPIPRNYSHDGKRFLFGRSEYDNVAVTIPQEIDNQIGEINFWTPMEKRRG